MDKKDIKVRIVDQDNYPGLDTQAMFFVETMRKRYNVTVLNDDTTNPDILFYTCYGCENLKWNNCIRIYHTAERDYPNYNLCDYAIGLSDIGIPDRFLHFPCYVFYRDMLNKCKEAVNEKIDPQKALAREFCCTVVSDPLRDPIYFEFVKKLNQYKKVESGGRVGNTIGFRVPDKLAFLNEFKFSMAFENMMAPGYVTEKIIDSFAAKTVPIYWGSDWVKKEFGEGGYINISDFPTVDDAIEYIKKVDNNDDLYLSILEKGPQLQHTYEEWCEILLDYLSNIVQNGTRIYDSRRNYDYNEKIVFYKIRNLKIVSLIRKIIRKINYFRIYGLKDVGTMYEGEK